MDDTPLDELKPKLEALGLRVEQHGDENDAEVYLGEEQFCTLKYYEIEEGWDVLRPYFCSLALPVDETVDGVKDELAAHMAKKKQVTFTVTVEYDENAPKASTKAEGVIAVLIADSITALVPSKPKPKAVVVNKYRHSLE